MPESEGRKLLFNSIYFITVFLPLALAGWYLLQRLENPLFAKLFLTGMSFWFYGFYNIKYLWILLASLAFNYGISALFESRRRHGGAAPEGAQPSASGGTDLAEKLIFWAGLAGNLGMLFYFKYFNFFIDNCNFFFHSDFHVEKIALPLGISFFTFQQISYVADRYLRRAEHIRLEDYCCFISFFPQLVAGPIVLHEEFIPQLTARRNRGITAEKFYEGMALFILGFSKKVLLADSLAVLVNVEYDNILWLDSVCAWCVILFYMLELYFDFSGYCDMARGLGKLFGFELPENFNSPLTADSVKDFWRRWHITLSRFFQKYVYIPLGGSRRGRARQCVNLLIVFLASGLWHGANWTFVVWGLMHGAAEVWETLFPKLRFPRRWANRLATGVYVTLSFSVFRSESLSQALLLWKRLFLGGFRRQFAGMCNMIQLPENYALAEFMRMAYPEGVNLVYMGSFFFLLFLSLKLIAGERAQEWIQRKGGSTSGAFLLATLFLWAFYSLSRVSVFLYFNF